MNKPTNGVYVHIPFCIKKCNYCDFVSYENCLTEAETYINAILSEMQAYKGAKADTLYIGGGTPTALSADLLVKLVLGLQKNFCLSPDAEITVEANPGTCDAAYLTALRQAGVNRLSFGVQSFVNEELRALGRIHTAAQAILAVENAYRAGILNVSLDLMFSIPLQTRDSLLHSLSQAIALNPTHISCYSLTLCEGTPLHRAATAGTVTLPDDETDRSFYAFIVHMLKEHGYSQYEISNFAKPGYIARHNTKYWMRAPYIGLGAAAHSFYDNRRFENPPGLTEYYRICQGKPGREYTEITEADAMAEFMFLGLRMTETGVLRKDFLKTFGQELDIVFEKQLKKLFNLKLLESLGDSIRLTPRGIDVSNQVFCEFLQ